MRRWLFLCLAAACARPPTPQGPADSTNVRTLRQLAGIAVANGMRWSDALAAITVVPAQIYGVKKRGTLAAGSTADVVVWSGDPLELSTRPLHLFVGGKELPLRSRQTLLLERYRKLP